MCSGQREGRDKGQEAEGAVPTTDEQDTPSGCTRSEGQGEQRAHCTDEQTEALREEVSCQGRPARLGIMPTPPTSASCTGLCGVARGRQG